MKIADNIHESQIDFGALRIFHKNQSFFKSPELTAKEQLSGIVD